MDLYYEVAGTGEPLVLIPGAGGQLLEWPEEIHTTLASRGFRVVRFDTRDAGLSTRFDEVGGPDLGAAIFRWLLGLPIDAPYTLADMARDVVGLLDALDIERAHVVGVSMGGMIAQALAIAHPERLLTMTSMLSHTGTRLSFLSHPRAIYTLLKNPALRDREHAVEVAIGNMDATGSPGKSHRDPATRARLFESFDRGYYPPGKQRRMIAVLASGDRTDSLRRVGVPTLVIHGSRDPLIRPWCGRATAQAIPGSTLEMIEGMGHDLHSAFSMRIVDSIERHALRQGGPQHSRRVTAPS
jgi:pimeloyl-ACP methyl ester carboxylesterase